MKIVNQNKDNEKIEESQNSSLDKKNNNSGKDKKHKERDYLAIILVFLKNWGFTLVLIFIFFFYPYLAGKSLLGDENKNIKNISLSELAAFVNEGKITEIKVSGQDLDIFTNINTNKDISTSSNLIATSTASNTLVSSSSALTYKSKKELESGVTESLKNLGAKEDSLSKIKINIIGESGFKYWVGTLGVILPILFFALMLFILIRSVKGANMGALSFGNTRAKKIMPDDKNKVVTFEDVAGAKVAKEELAEIVEFLKKPEKFIDIGAVIPKGVLMTGVPGTGKTLLARAVAGEAGVPFFHLSGSEFIEMFVGVGASRVRDLFSEAKKSSPAIIFIDEIDSIGRSRGVGTGGGNDEREQTLNQILVEMDGFEPTQKIIVMAATNRSDILDSALLRPGRFDRRIVIDLPDRGERKDILVVHSKGKKFGSDINLDLVATRTPGFSGAELASLLNEAAILAAREKRTEIAQYDIIRSIEKVMLGAERKSHLMGEEEKRLVAYHEAGHALVAAVLPHADPVHKISIISRGSAGGYTLKLPTDERRLNNKNVFIDDIAMTFGGYAAEELIAGVTSTGPSSDIEQATAMARAMVTRYGMSELVGPISIESDRNAINFGRASGDKMYSNEFSKLIDDEIKRIVEDGRNTARRVVREYKKVLDHIAGDLIEKENMEREDFELILKAHGIAVKK